MEEDVEPEVEFASWIEPEPEDRAEEEDLLPEALVVVDCADTFGDEAPASEEVEETIMLTGGDDDAGVITDDGDAAPSAATAASGVAAAAADNSLSCNTLGEIDREKWDFDDLCFEEEEGTGRFPEELN